MKNIAVFASGSGTNAENIIRHFHTSSVARVALLIADNSDAYALKRAEKYGIPAVVVPRSDFRGEGVLALAFLNTYKIDYIVLAGFLSLVPSAIIEAYRGRIVNIHPALLPKYGGKGMYGDRVHCAVVENRECESGITIHHVDEVYDSGSTIAQYRVNVLPEDTPQTLAAKIHELEYQHFPRVIEQVITFDDPLMNRLPMTQRDREVVKKSELPYAACMAIGAGISIIFIMNHIFRHETNLKDTSSLTTLLLLFIAGSFCIGQLVRFIINRKYYKALRDGTKIIVPAFLQYKEEDNGSYYLIVNNVRYQTIKDVFNRVNEGELIETHSIPKSFSAPASDINTKFIDSHIAATYFIFLGFYPYGYNRK